MRLHRLIAILLLVESRGKIKAGELAEALETSVRSVYRDIDVLAEAGIPMTATPGPGGGISLMPGYTVNLRQLHGDEVLQLYLTGMGFRSAEPGESGLKLRSALLKLEQTLPPEYKADLRKAVSRFYFDDTPWWSERPEVIHLETLRGALLRTARLQMSYRKVSGEVSLRTVQPYGLIVKRGEWYLAAFCETAQALRTFKCERITAAEAAAGSYDIPEGFSLEAYWKEQEQDFKQSRKKMESYPVVIRMSRADGDIFKRQKQLEIIDSSGDSDTVVVKVNMHDYGQACLEILTLPHTAEILEPYALREYMRQRIRQWGDMYL